MTVATFGVLVVSAVAAACAYPQDEIEAHADAAVSTPDGATPREASTPPVPPPATDAAAPEAGCTPLAPDAPIAPVFGSAEPPFVFELGPSARHAAHANGGNPHGTKCIVCHNPGGNGVPFLFAGSAAGPRRGGAEVRFRDARGVVTAVHTDADGNFYFRLDRQPSCFEFPVRGGVRTAGGTKMMTDTRTTGNCNGCHVMTAP
jgi:hypothetical protein